MHEQSETVERKGGYVNVYGRKTPQAGQPLPKKYSFEQDVYPDVKSAVHAARKRSQQEGRMMIRNAEPRIQAGPDETFDAVRKR